MYMKIAVICPDGRSIVLFCKGIVKAFKSIENAEVFILCATDEYMNEIKDLGVKHIPIDIYRFFSPIKDLKLIIQLYGIFRKEQFDIVYNIATKPNIYGTLAARIANLKKVIVHVVGLGSGFLLTNNLREKFVRYIFLRLYHIALIFSDNVWFFNKNDYQFFISRKMLVKEKCILTKSFLDVDYYSEKTVNQEELSYVRNELKLHNNDKLVLMIGRLIWPKGIKEFIESAELLKDEHPFIKFLLIAPPEKGNFDEVPESFITSKKLPNFMWIKYRNDLRPYYAISDLKVLPSYYKEGGHPRALLEAMAMGKPIITTNSKDCSDVVENEKNGLLIPIKDSKALADAIFSLIMDAEKLKQFGKHSRNKIENEFDERKIIPQAFCKLGLSHLPNNYGCTCHL